jgi:ubiquinone/menaquinone biosynthesis C-methylase UbiE
MLNATGSHGYVSSPVLHKIARLTARLKGRLTELLQVQRGDRILDVGCGPGLDTVAAARLVGEQGLVVGIDHDEQMILEARKRARRAGVETWTRHQTADAAAIPYRTGSFDASRSERLFQHVPDPGAVLREMARVTRPGGRIAVADADWGTLSIHTTEVEIERRITRLLPGLVQNGYAGRELLRLFRAQFLTRVVVEVHPIVWQDYATFWATSFSLPDLRGRLLASGVVSEADFRCFRLSLAEAQRRRSFFASGNMVLVAAENRRRAVTT